METGDWKTTLQPDSRQRIVNKIAETLRKCFPVSGNEGLTELKKISQRFEEKIYAAATSQSDYLRKISLKMYTMESKYNNAASSAANSSQPRNLGNSGNCQRFSAQPKIGLCKFSKPLYLVSLSSKAEVEQRRRRWD